ncbi:MAG: hypothetical protein ACC656_10915, partial [Candidatus Heimdallarchaeota archaeon]
MVSIARWITAILGFYSTYLLYQAYTTLEQEVFANFDDAIGALIGSLLILFLHLVVEVLGFPFLFYSIVGKDKIPKWFVIVIGIESI